MPLSAGDRLGPYEILAPIGAGGMGEVYRARDTRLNRTVAIKIVKGQFSERFEREARAISALNHPNICTLYDIGSQNGVSYLVMECVEGKPLKGPLPPTEALRVVIQIAGALDESHGKGITHRDLKPGNVLVTKSGVKLLDFGLARVAQPDNRAVDVTLTAPLTGRGEILGTLNYMSPEQLEGKDADARSDIFSLGLVLYEMLTGRRAFDGSSQASLIAAILREEPPTLSSLQPLTPPLLERTVRKCLAKDPEQRWQSARDLKHELEWIAASGAPVPAAVTRSAWRERAAWIVAAVCLGASLFLATRSSPRPTGELARFNIYPPEKTIFSDTSNATVPAPQLVLSPDGRAIVFVATMEGARPMLWLRTIEEIAARPLPGTENAENPFWSPDSRWVAFFSEAKLKKIPISGGPVQAVVEGGYSETRGGSWSPDGTIVFATGNSDMYRIPSSGGAVTTAMKLDTSQQEATIRYPYFLPDGRHFVFNIRGGSAERVGIYAGSVDGKTKKFLARFDSNAIYASPGYLLFLDGETLFGQAFDAERLVLSGHPFAIADRVGRSSAGYGSFSAAGSSALAYTGATKRICHLTWFDRAGAELDSTGPEGDYTDFRLSPDEKRLVASMVDPKRAMPGIWLTDLERGSTSRFTTEGGINSAPVWSPDGARIVFRTSRRAPIEFYQRSAAGGGAEELVLSLDTQRAAETSASHSIPTDWSPDGRYILYSASSTGSGFDLWLLPASGAPGASKPVVFLNSPADEIQGVFSPDGQLVAYTSNESGRHEVHVQTFPLSDRKWQVSTSGGYEPRWRRDGREIYYLSEDRKLMAVPVSAGPSFGAPKPLFQTRVPMGVNQLHTNYVPSSDGRRFLVNTQTGDPAPNPITVVLNWTAGLGK